MELSNWYGKENKLTLKPNLHYFMVSSKTEFGVLTIDVFTTNKKDNRFFCK